MGSPLFENVATFCRGRFVGDLAGRRGPGGSASRHVLAGGPGRGRGGALRADRPAVHRQQPGRHRREAVVGQGFGPRRRDHRPAMARRASRPRCCAAACISACWRWQYRIHRVPLVTVPQGKIGYVYARDGEPLAPSQTLGCVVACNNFQDARGFLVGEQVSPDQEAITGQRGRQRAILREGVYAINLALFYVLTEDTVYRLDTGGAEGIQDAGQLAERAGRARRLQPGGHRRPDRDRRTRSIPTRRSWSTAWASSRSTTARRCRRARSSPRPWAPTATTSSSTTTTRTPRRSSWPAGAGACSTCR